MKESFNTAMGMQHSSAAVTAVKYQTWSNRDVDLLLQLYVYITATKRNQNTHFDNMKLEEI